MKNRYEHLKVTALLALFSAAAISAQWIIEGQVLHFAIFPLILALIGIDIFTDIARLEKQRN